jgi:hypothetical protein
MEPIPEDKITKLNPKSMCQLYIQAITYAKTATISVETINTLNAQGAQFQPSKIVDSRNNRSDPHPPKKLFPAAVKDFNLGILSDSIFKDVTPKYISPNSTVLSWPGATTDQLNCHVHELDVTDKTFKTIVVNIGICNIGEALTNDPSADPDQTGTDIAYKVLQTAAAIKSKLSPQNLYIAKLPSTSGKYQHFNPFIKKIYEELEAKSEKLVDLELYPDLNHDGLHPSFPAGVTEMVRSVRKVMRQTGTGTATHVQMTTPWRLRDYQHHNRNTSYNQGDPTRYPNNNSNNYQRPDNRRDYGYNHGGYRNQRGYHYGLSENINPLNLDTHSKVQFIPNFFDSNASPVLFNVLYKSLKFKSYTPQRKELWFGNYSYGYGTTTQLANPKFTQVILHIKQVIEQYLKVAFNSVLCNLYENGQSYIPWHSDDESSIVKDYPIVSLSFGATRSFYMCSKRNLKTLRFDLISGSLLSMEGSTQDISNTASSRNYIFVNPE